MSFHKFELDGNGFVFNLLHLLWLQDPIFKNNILIDIPDTIQIIQGQPHFWYYSQNSQLFRKSKSKLNLEDIQKSFLANNNEICAVWITQNTIYEYLSPQQLQNLISSINFETMGILQRFIYPKNVNNQVLKCTWGNSICFFESITNKYPINSNRADIYQKAVTFEMPNGPIISSTLKGTMLSQKLELLCGTIASHVANVTQSQKQISQMEIYCKLASNDRLYLLQCSRLKTLNSNQRLFQASFQITSKISKQMINYPKPLKLSNNTQCVGCDKERNEIDFNKVKLKDIINGWDKNEDKQQPKLIKQKKSIVWQVNPSTTQIVKIEQNQQIPKIIKILYPKLQLKEFLDLKGNIFFMNQSIQLCSTCCTNILYRQDGEQAWNQKIIINKTAAQRLKTEQPDEVKKLIPVETTRNKRELYYKYMENKTLNDYTRKRLSGAISWNSEQFKQTPSLIMENKSINAISIFKTTQSSRQGINNYLQIE